MLGAKGAFCSPRKWLFPGAARHASPTRPAGHAAQLLAARPSTPLPRSGLQGHNSATNTGKDAGKKKETGRPSGARMGSHVAPAKPITRFPTREEETACGVSAKSNDHSNGPPATDPPRASHVMQILEGQRAPRRSTARHVSVDSANKTDGPPRIGLSNCEVAFTQPVFRCGSAPRFVSCGTDSHAPSTHPPILLGFSPNVARCHFA